MFILGKRAIEPIGGRSAHDVNGGHSHSDIHSDITVTITVKKGSFRKDNLWFSSIVTLSYNMLQWHKTNKHQLNIVINSVNFCGQSVRFCV